MMVAWCPGYVVAACVLVMEAKCVVAASDTTTVKDSRSSSSSHEVTTSPASVSSSSHVEDYDAPLDVPVKNITFTRILFFCEFQYSVRFGSYSGLTPSMLYRNSTINVAWEEKFVNLCLPQFYNRECEEKQFISICLADGVVFLHGHGCVRPSPQDVYFYLLLAETLLEDDDACFAAVCSGKVRVVRREVESYTVHVFSPPTQYAVCHKYLLSYYPAQRTATFQTFRNVHWPCCLAGYEVVWSREAGSGRGDGTEVVKTWSYLPPYCRAAEHTLAAVMTLVVVGGVAGNVLVLVLCVWKSSLSNPSVILRVSLAAAELLVGVVVLAPALDAHLRLMHGAVAGEGLLLGVSGVTGARELFGIGVEEVEGGFLMSSAHVLNIGLAVALPTVLLLTLEQISFVSDWSLQKITVRRCQGFVAANWSLGVLLSLALVHIGGAFWYSFYKLPLSIPPWRPGVVLMGAAVIFGVMVSVTVVVSFVVIWRAFKGGAERRHLTLVLMTTILHVVTAGTGGAALMLNLSGTSEPQNEVARFLCWWTFLFFTCWHPWLLCLSHRNIREVVVALVGGRQYPWLKRLLALFSFVSNSATTSPPPSPRPPPPPRHKLAPGRRHRFLPGVRYYR